ncbi:helix-turn-helix domain-containing protein [Saccharibacillus brassicae]|uniref:Helix-turn-helix domain-containing protein n=1 Tax=Saccharibacillus brassicae TaxID=2583377 RepID=A0A4Y6USH2_SACBS|nr:helix-turn-helix domain-containing protein [Saccharibacillus brassicae]QDH19994.1 helix-turn-helix domain-containing protein [Saccharibacillus brassicae]
MATKGQTFCKYSYETKLRAVQMRMDGMTKKQVAKELGIYDLNRLKIWMRKYKAEGELGLIDHRGRREDAFMEQEFVENELSAQSVG